MQKVPMIVVVGDQEVENRQVALRDRRAKERSTVALEAFIEASKQKLNEVNF
jgi:threonyl-tRNA synthetase